MKFLKLTGIAAAVAVSGAILFNLGLGFGSVKQINTCAENQSVCETVNVLAGYEGGELQVTAKAKETSSFSGSIKEACAESAASALSTGINTIQIQELSFSGCEPCTKVTASKLPFKGEGFATSAGNGELVVPITVSLTGCPFGVTCLYANSKASMSGLGSSTQPQIAVSEVPLTKLEGGAFCPASSKWTAKYVITKAVERIFEVGGVSFERELPLSGFIESETE